MKVIAAVLGVLALSVGFSVLGALIVMAIYNNAVADPFDLPRLGFLQTWGIMFLLGIVTSYFRRNGK